MATSDSGRHQDRAPTAPTSGLSLRDRFFKRALDLAVAIVGIATTWWLMALTWAVATVDTRRNGLFSQVRIGRNGLPFRVYKIRTMRDRPGMKTTVTTDRDPRITRFGRLLRKTKLDELPQLVNVLRGDMSLVGPRPDVPGFADRLKGEDRLVLSVRPGITGPATLRFRDEEELLSRQIDPDRYNCELLFPEKVRLNRQYVERYRLRDDLKYLWWTLRGVRPNALGALPSHEEKS